MDFIAKHDTLVRIAYYIQTKNTNTPKEFAKEIYITKDRLKDFMTILKILAAKEKAKIRYYRRGNTYYFRPKGKFTEFKFKKCLDKKIDTIPQDVPDKGKIFIKELNRLTKMAYFIHLKQTGTRKEFAEKCGFENEETLKKYIIILKELADEEDAKICYDRRNNNYYFIPQGYFTNFEFVITADYQQVVF